jgi:hypothetical protein
MIQWPVMVLASVVTSWSAPSASPDPFTLAVEAPGCDEGKEGKKEGKKDEAVSPSTNPNCGDGKDDDKKKDGDKS